jgi:hypothetical protein
MNNQQSHATLDILRFVVAWSTNHRQLVQRRLLDGSAGLLKQPEQLQRILPVVSACLLHNDVQARLLGALVQQTDALIKILLRSHEEKHEDADAASLVACSAAHVLERCYLSAAASSSAVAKLRTRVLDADMRHGQSFSSARLSLAYALACPAATEPSAAAISSLQRFIERTLYVLSSVLELDDAHPFRVQVVATLGTYFCTSPYSDRRDVPLSNPGLAFAEAALKKAREWEVEGSDEAGMKWVQSLSASGDVQALLHGRVGGLVPTLIRHYCTAEPSSSTRGMAKTLHRLVVSSPAFSTTLRAPNAASPSALSTHAKHSLALSLYTLYRFAPLHLFVP